MVSIQTANSQELAWCAVNTPHNLRLDEEEYDLTISVVWLVIKECLFMEGVSIVTTCVIVSMFSAFEALIIFQEQHPIVFYSLVK